MSQRKFKIVPSTHLAKARKIIQWYIEGSDLEDWQTHMLNDCAAEHCQILDNVVHTQWFAGALAENIEALAGTGGETDSM